MKHLFLNFLTISCLICAGGLAAQEVVAPSAGEERRAEQVREEMVEFKAKYLNTGTLRGSPDQMRMVRGSPDHQRFKALVRWMVGEYKTSGTFFEELIDLTQLREVRPDTTEDFIPLELTPAGQAFNSLGAEMRPIYEARLAEGNLTDWQKDVLNELIYFSDLREDAEKNPDGISRRKFPPLISPDPNSIVDRVDPIYLQPKPKSPPASPEKAAPLIQESGEKSAASPHGSDPRPPAQDTQPVTPNQWLLWTLVALLGIGGVGFFLKGTMGG